MAKNVILTETGFKNIYRGYLKYIALQSGGVDNWEWYGDCGHLTFFIIYVIIKEKRKELRE